MANKSLELPPKQLIKFITIVIFTTWLSLCVTDVSHAGTKTGKANADLIKAATNNNAAGVVKAIANGADVNSEDEEGNTALMHACIVFGENSYPSSNPEMVRLLIQSGANVNLQDKYGWTPLMRLTEAKDDSQKMLATAKILIAHGAKIGIRNKSGDTAFMLAASNTCLPLLKLLWKSVPINQKDHDGDTALTLACTGPEDTESDWIDTVEGVITFLLKHKANPNVMNNKGSTALMNLAIWNADYEPELIKFCKILVAHGAKAQIKDNHGKTASDLAKEHNMIKLARYLESVSK